MNSSTKQYELLALALFLIMRSAPSGALVFDLQIGHESHCEIATEVVPGSGRFGPFPGVEEAVVAATNVYNPVSMLEDREYMGAILHHPERGEYLYTVDAGHAAAGEVTVRISIPEGFSIAGFWHTHGEAGATRHLFSQTDTDLVEEWGVPLFLADYTGILKVYRPGSHTRWRYGIPIGGSRGKGENVRHRNSRAIVTIGTKEDKTCWCLHHSANSQLIQEKIS